MASSSPETASAAPDMLVSVENGAGLLTMNRPKKLHTLTLDMVRLVSPALDGWRADDTIECFILRSAPWGGKAFCAGGDVRAVYDQGVGGDPVHGQGNRGVLTGDFFREEYEMNYKIATFPKPQVSFWDGIVMGGGVGLSCHGKFRVATEKTVFAMPETAIGLFPDVGMTHVLPKLHSSAGRGGVASPLGIYVGLTGVRLNCDDLLFSGLATHVVPSDNLEGLNSAIVNAGARSPEDLDALLTDFQNSGNAGNKDQSKLAARLDAIERCFSKETMEEIIHALHEETVESDWASKTLKMMSTQSPTSLKVTLRLLQEHASKDLDECLKTEYRVAQRFMRPKADFYEGIRAVLVDRNDPPASWAPASLEGVSDAAVGEFFAPLPAGNELEL